MVKFVGNQLGLDRATIDEVVAFLSRQTVVGIDIETSRKFKKGTYPETVYKPALDPRVSRIVMLQIGNLEERYVIDTRSVNIEKILPFFSSHILWVGANLGFEYKHILHNYGVRLKNIWDVMIVDICLWNGYRHGYSLKDISSRYFNVFDAEKVNLFNLNVYNDVLETFWQDQDTYLIDKSTAREFINIGDRPFTLKQINYGADDIELPLKIFERQKHGRLVGKETYNPTELFILENNVVKVLAEMSYNGLPFRGDMWLDLAKKSSAKMAELKAKLDKYVEEHHHDFCVASFDLFSTDKKCNIKWASSKQVLPLFKKLGVAAVEKRKNGTLTDSVGEKALIYVLDLKHKRDLEDHIEYPIESPQDLVVQYLHYKHYEQLVKTFGKDYLKFAHPITGRIHPNYYQIVSTGRMSASTPNVQQIPSDTAYRDCFSSKLNVVGADFSQQEIRVLAHVSGVEPMIDFFTSTSDEFEGDFHSYTASLVERMRTGDQSIVVTKKSNPEARQRAKVTNFQVGYGASAVALAKEFGTEVEVAEKFLSDYFAAWTGMTEYRKQAQKEAYEKGYVDIDPFGRRWFDPDWAEMKRLSDFAWSFFPDEYRYLSGEDRAKVKADIYARHPECQDAMRKSSRMRGSLERKALNYPIQGSAGSQTKLALWYIYDRLLTDGLLDEVKLVVAVHDEIVSEVKPEYANFAAELISGSMERAGTDICPSVPFVAEPYIDIKWKK